MCYMTNIPHLKNWDREKIQLVRSGDEISLYYVTDKKIPFHTKTNSWTCPFGKDDQNKIISIVSDEEFFKLEELDNYGKDVCKYFMEKEGLEIDKEDLPYKSLMSKQDGLDVISLTISNRTKFFDNNGNKIPNDQTDMFTSGQFTGYFLLNYSLRIWRAGNTITKFYWIVTPAQIRVKNFCSLPEGCEIFEDEDHLQVELDKRKENIIGSEIIEEPVTNFDPEVNELID